jgi:hypothetical protein
MNPERGLKWPQGLIEVDRWEVTDDYSGKVHIVSATVDGQWLKCDCNWRRGPGQCGAIEAVATYLETEASTGPVQ